MKTRLQRIAAGTGFIMLIATQPLLQPCLRGCSPPPRCYSLAVDSFFNKNDRK